MLTQLPTLVVVIIYLLAALLPALFLMRYIYRKDTIGKEPKGMLVGLVFLGVAAAVVAVILETLGLSLLSRFLEEGDPAHTIVMAFLVVAVVERHRIVGERQESRLGVAQRAHRPAQRRAGGASLSSGTTRLRSPHRRPVGQQCAIASSSGRTSQLRP